MGGRRARAAGAAERLSGSLSGYPGQAEAFPAMERGELDGYPSVFYSSQTAFKPERLRDKKLKLLVRFGTGKRPEFPDAPAMMAQLRQLRQ